MTLTADQRMIQTEAARFLSERAPRAAVRAVIEGGGGTDAALWATISKELGWCAMAIPEDQGGLGLGAPEVAMLMKLAGAALAPIPLWANTCLATPLLVGLGAASYVARIATGEITATLALPNLDANDGGKPMVEAEALDDGYRLSGRVAAVVDGAAADLILLPALLPGMEDGTTALFALPATAAQRNPLVVMDATRPMVALDLDGVILPAEARLDTDGISHALMAQVLDFGRLGLAAEQIGTAVGVLDMTQAFIAERVQFGRTIASFQAIKHRCAALQVQLAEARALAWGAAAGFAERATADRQMEIAALKALADDLARTAAREAIQLHGGVAMTWEYDPHFYLKRAHANAVLLGQADVHLDRIAAALLDAEA